MLKEDERVAYQAAFNTFDWLKKWNKNWQIILPMMMTMLSRMTMMVITNLMKTFNMVMTIMVIRNMMKTSRMMMTMLSKMVKTNMMKTIVMTIMVVTMTVMTKGWWWQKDPRSNNGRVAHSSLQDVMRRAGLNPTDIEVGLGFFE